MEEVVGSIPSRSTKLMATLEVVDAWYSCCGSRFDSKEDLREHQILARCEGLRRVLEQHDAMWKVLKRTDQAIWMRKELDLT